MYNAIVNENGGKQTTECLGAFAAILPIFKERLLLMYCFVVIANCTLLIVNYLSGE